MSVSLCKNQTCTNSEHGHGHIVLTVGKTTSRFNNLEDLQSFVDHVIRERRNAK